MFACTSAIVMLPAPALLAELSAPLILLSSFWTLPFFDERLPLTELCSGCVASSGAR